MPIRRLFRDEDAISPVIGVILIIAITVILAAVVASFAFGLQEEKTYSPPEATFSFENTGTSGEVKIVHEAGDGIPNDQISVRGGGTTEDSPVTESEINAGNSVTLTTFSSGTEIRVVWDSEQDDTTEVLAKGTVPWPASVLAVVTTAWRRTVVAHHRIVGLDKLEQSLLDAPIIEKEGYHYFVHPISDGVPMLRPELLREIVIEIIRKAELDEVYEAASSRLAEYEIT